MIIGVTGPSGAGKGTVSSMLCSHGFIHIDTDIIAREVSQKLLPQLAEKFGKEILKKDGSLDRSELAKRAFSSDENTKALNGIMHGAIMKRVKEIIDEKKQNGGERFVIDGAALFEAKGNEMCDYVIAVLCDEKTRLKRITERDGITEKQAIQRFSRQISEDFLKANCDFVVVNNSIPDTKKQISIILNKIYGGTK